MSNCIFNICRSVSHANFLKFVELLECEAGMRFITTHSRQTGVGDSNSMTVSSLGRMLYIIHNVIWILNVNVLLDKEAPRPQTLFFSATLPRWVTDTAKRYMTVMPPVIDLVGNSVNQTATNVTVSYLFTNTYFFNIASSTNLIFSTSYSLVFEKS